MARLRFFFLSPSGLQYRRHNNINKGRFYVMFLIGPANLSQAEFTAANRKYI